MTGSRVERGARAKTVCVCVCAGMCVCGYVCMRKTSRESSLTGDL
jgi:hypothetical protein